jgi:hypothetical protein
MALLLSGLSGQLFAKPPGDKTPQPPLEYKLSEVEISLSRGACDGFCPVYTVAVHGGGMVAYQGDRNVAVEGQDVAMISPEAVQGLLEAIYASGFLKMRDKHLSGHAPKVTDGGRVIVNYLGSMGSPRFIVIFSVRDYTKRVVFEEAHAPAELVELADRIDELTGSAKWVEGK